MRPKWILLLTLLLFSVCRLQAGNQRVLYAFTGGVDGSQPMAGVVLDSAGNLYGVTQWGGTNGRGNVFQLTPASDGTWTETVLYSFLGGSDGEQPLGGLVIDRAGNLYGTTSSEGDSSIKCGTIFKLSPSAGGWTFTVLHTFLSGEDGCGPQDDLQLVFDNLLLGTTAGGGSGAQGTAFGLSTTGSDYNKSSFLKGNGNYPGGLGVATWGNGGMAVYGNTYYGGAPGVGNVFELAKGAGFSWYGVEVKRVFHTSGDGGYWPEGNLGTSRDTDGLLSLFGTTSHGGVGGRGTVYRLTQSQWQSGVFIFTVLHAFSGPDGDSPSAGVVLDAAGNLYGTTRLGGNDAGQAGTVFRLTPAPKSRWAQTLLYSFTGGADGAVPISGVALDRDGNLYGTTYQGGTYNKGVVYEIVYTSAFPKPTSLAFGPQPVNTTSPPQRIALFNPSTIPIAVTSVNVQGDFAVSQNRCQNGVLPKTHCDVYVTFTPTGPSPKPRIGSVTFTDTSFDTPQTVTLTGTVPTPTKTTVVSSSSPSFVNHDVTFTATVTAAQGTVPDGDPVEFFAGYEPLGVMPITGGIAQIDTQYLDPGNNWITAQYAGDRSFASSSGKTLQVVYKEPTVTTLTSYPDPSSHGQAVTFTATVTTLFSDPPSGLVRFWDGKKSIAGVYLYGQVATFTTSNLAVGTHPITAQFVGTYWLDTSTSPVVTQVVQ
jgi:uncharacterized repeat protein (TIGR03803 family)